MYLMQIPIVKSDIVKWKNQEAIVLDVHYSEKENRYKIKTLDENNTFVVDENELTLVGAYAG